MFSKSTRWLFPRTRVADGAKFLLSFGGSCILSANKILEQGASRHDLIPLGPFLALTACLALLPAGVALAQDAPANDTLNAVLWMQRSVEYKANTLGAFALAQIRLDTVIPRLGVRIREFAYSDTVLPNETRGSQGQAHGCPVRGIAVV